MQRYLGKALEKSPKPCGWLGQWLKGNNTHVGEEPDTEQSKLTLVGTNIYDDIWLQPRERVRVFD